MEPTSSPDNARQSRGLARFWPVHGMPAPAQRHPDDDHEDGMDQENQQQDPQPPAVSHSASAQAAAAAQLASPAGEDALTSETQMVALGSRRGFDLSNGSRGWSGNQGGFPPMDRNGEPPPLHGGNPVPNGAPFVVPAAATPPPPVEQQAPQAPRAPFGPPVTPTSGARAPFPPASPFAPQAEAPPAAPQQQQQPARPDENVRGIPLGASAESPKPPSEETPRGAASVPVSGRRRSAEAEAAAETGNEVDTKPEETGNEQANGQSRPATGWASVPTSGIPTISGNAAVSNANGRAVDAPADEPVAGSLVTPISPASPVAAPGTAAADQAQQGGQRRLASLADADAALPRAGRRTAALAPVSAGPLRPGDLNPSQIAFWDEEAITHFRSEWHEVKANFVDDPVSALTRAHDLLTDAVNELSEALLAERDELDPLRDTSTPDTESMRMAMRGYREFLDRILAL